MSETASENETQNPEVKEEIQAEVKEAPVEEAQTEELPDAEGEETEEDEAELQADSSEEEEVEPEPAPRRRIPTGPRSMTDIRIGKVVVNISAGKSGEPLDRAMTILTSITGQKPATRRAKQTIRTFGIRRGEPIACMVTLRGEKAEGFLKQAFVAVRNRLNVRSFDQHGNFAFGIREHIDIPGQRYDPNLGIIGMDIMATVERPGYRVARRRRAKNRVGHSHRVTRDEAIEFISQSFGVEVGLPDE
jgi:large subunit ribosomal protein L5